MKTLVVGQQKREIERLLKRIGFKIVANKPDFVFSYGGDGTLLRAEFLFPGVPKVILRKSSVCKLCSPLSNEEIIKRIHQKNFSLREFWKLDAIFGTDHLVALNEIVIHNKNPQHGIRYRVFLDKTDLGKEFIGDGLVVATPFGSTGYYRSIADSYFELGIGIAFNNSTEQADSLVVKEQRQIKVLITRGPALLYADNQTKIINLKEQDLVLIKKSSQVARIVKF